MKLMDLNCNELAVCKNLIRDLQECYQSAAAEDFLAKASLYATELPLRVKSFYQELKYNNLNRGMTVLRGFPIENNIGQTPEKWDYHASYRPTLAIDYFSVLLSSLLGNVFGWETQQKGKIIHDLIPIKGKETAQTGYGSHSELVMHTEDSFHPLRADYLNFYCIRNPSKVSTTFASVRDLDLTDEVKKVLFQERFSIRPDDSHLDKEQLSRGRNGQHMQKRHDEDPKIAMLYGNFDQPFICFDPYYTDNMSSDPQGKEALQILIAQMTQHTLRFALSPGDICILDNRKMVHGREPFEPSYNGNDRWLKRINITTDLRRSADSRVSAQSLIIGDSMALEEDA